MEVGISPKEIKPYGYIYETKNLVNSKCYIGQHKDEFKKSYFGSGVVLAKALKKYGRRNFKIRVICETDSKENQNNLEIQHVDTARKMWGIENVYNLSSGGECGNAGVVRTKEWNRKIAAGSRQSWKNPIIKEKHRQSMIGNKYTLGYHHRQESIEKIRKSHCKPLPPGTAKKISQSLKGRPFSLLHRENLIKAWKNPETRFRHITEEWKEKLRIASTGRTHSKESKEKIRKALLGRIITDEWHQHMLDAWKIRKLKGATNNVTSN